ncbi:MAG: hypothetical protein AB7M12_12965 [Hyphomonadaceae bacterium]
MGKVTLGALLWAAAMCATADAARWLRIDPNDPYGGEGAYHWFDIDSAYEDPATGWVYAWGAYATPAKLAAQDAPDGFLWAFDCAANTVRSAASREAGVINFRAEWRAKTTDLSTPQMGGVTNAWGRRLCALKGSWPLKAIGP